jgi:hypothetical protein
MLDNHALRPGVIAQIVKIKTSQPSAAPTGLWVRLQELPKAAILIF